MLQAISKASHNSRYIYVMDTRPKVTNTSFLLNCFKYAVSYNWIQHCIKTAEDLQLICFSSVLQLNALANRAAGKGYENEDNYSNIRFQFVGIENIHVMRASLQKLLEG